MASRQMGSAPRTSRPFTGISNMMGGGRGGYQVEDDEEKDKQGGIRGPAQVTPQTAGAKPIQGRGPAQVGGQQQQPAANRGQAFTAPDTPKVVQPAGVQRKARRGGFVGINRYLGAQQDAGERMAEGLATGIEQRGEEARTGISGLTSGFQSQAGTGGIKEAAEAVAQYPGKVTDAQQQALVGGYTGPKELSELGGYADVQQNIADLGTRLGQTESGAGTRALLREQLGGQGGYTGGMSRLDSAILGADTGAQERFSGLRQALGGVGGELGAAEGAAQERAAQAAREAGDYLSAAQKSVTGHRDTLADKISATQEEATGAAQKEYSKAMSYLGGDKYSPNDDSPEADKWRAEKAEVMKQYGLDKMDSMDMQRLTQSGGKLSDYIKGPSEITTSQAATAKQRARDAALAKLAGGLGLEGQTQHLVSAEAGADPAGTRFDVKKAKEAAKKQKSASKKRQSVIDKAAKDRADKEADMKLKAAADVQAAKDAYALKQKQKAYSEGVDRIGKASDQLNRPSRHVPNLATQMNRW